MMDRFNIGLALQAVSELYFTMARRTERTKKLVDSIQAGDVVCFLNSNHKLEFERRLKSRRPELAGDVKLLSVDPDLGSIANRLGGMGTPQGQLILDHALVEELYLRNLRHFSEGLERFEQEYSGFGSAHLDTQEKARQIHNAGIDRLAGWL